MTWESTTSTVAPRALGVPSAAAVAQNEQQPQPGDYIGRAFGHQKLEWPGQVPDKWNGQSRRIVETN